jgi:hypothetical protein
MKYRLLSKAPGCSIKPELYPPHELSLKRVGLKCAPVYFQRQNYNVLTGECTPVRVSLRGVEDNDEPEIRDEVYFWVGRRRRTEV